MISRHAISSLLFAALLLAGCSSADKSEPVPTASVQGCDASVVQGLIGQTASPALLEEARQRAGAQTARVIGPHDSVTLDYNSKRLNMDIDERLVIRQIHCG
ncbi:I78 family peptidase inhibitor [Azotobacter armeniacus]